MPKRSNDFQELIKTIYEQIVPQGGSVTESGMVLDKEAEILREVDILVEYRYAGHKFRFIVECRDRSRAETIEWVDSLIGKSKSLNVNKVIAVSSKGFASTAEKKAMENGIETLTLEEAKETDWTKFPIKPGILVFTDDTYKIQDVLYKSNGDYMPIVELGLESNVVIGDEVAGDVRGLVEYFFREHLAPNIDQYKKEHFMEIFKTKEDATKTLLVESEHDWKGIFVINTNGQKIEIKKIKFIVTGNRQTSDVPQKHHIFNNKMISTGEYPDKDGTTIKFNIVQDPDTGKIHGRWRKTKADA